MSLEIIPLGGYSEIGRNCTAVKVDDEVVILDLGLMLDRYIEYTESDDIVDLSARRLIEAGAIPDITVLGELRKHVVAVCISHGHLDHVGAAPYLANRLDADIHASKMTAEVLKNLTFRDRKPLRNRIVTHNTNSSFRITRRIRGEFLHLTHSIPQTVGVLLHTPYGSVAYLNDFKFDRTPTLGRKTNTKRLKELRGIKALILDSLYANVHGRAKSEKIAKEMLFDEMLNTNTVGKTIVITTFSSHIARLKSIAELARKMGRTAVFLGRSMDKYISAAASAGVCDLQTLGTVIPYKKKVDAFLRNKRDLSKHLLVMTGHQGEPKAVLTRTFTEGILRLRPDDIVVFSSTTIPVPVCEENRSRIEEALKQRHIRIFTDLHVSGHGAKEDLRDVINILRPEHLIPTHGDMPQLGEMRQMAIDDLKYPPENVHILYNGQRIRLA